MRRAGCRRRRDDRGFVTTEMVLVTPLLLVLLQFVIFAGRFVDARSDVVSAARDAARAASIQRSQADAEIVARETVRADLEGEGVRCVDPPVVSFSYSGPNGRGFVPGNFVHVRVSCEMRLSDMAWINIPGQRSSEYEAVEVIDVFRGSG